MLAFLSPILARDIILYTTLGSFFFVAVRVAKSAFWQNIVKQECEAQDRKMQSQLEGSTFIRAFGREPMSAARFAACTFKVRRAGAACRAPRAGATRCCGCR